MKPVWEKEALLTESKWARVFSPSNIALAKYWGKRDTALNLPANASLSLTLKDFGSFTTVEFDKHFEKDCMILNGSDETQQMGKAQVVLNELRALAGVSERARIQSLNNFPTAAGLASSASGLSALTLASARALNLDLPADKLSRIARRGSGSACRSLFGGFVEWKMGELEDGSDSVAEQIAAPAHWPLQIVIAVINEVKKPRASTGAMEASRKTSPFFKDWVEGARADVEGIRNAVLARDFGALADLAESNCLRMHSTAMSARPPIVYWQGRTLDVIHEVMALRESGVGVFFTIDAGPNVVTICEPEAKAKVKAALSAIGGLTLLETEIGEGAHPLAIEGDSR